MIIIGAGISGLDAVNVHHRPHPPAQASLPRTCMFYRVTCACAYPRSIRPSLGPHGRAPLTVTRAPRAKAHHVKHDSPGVAVGDLPGYCYFAGTPSSSLLKRLLNGEGAAE